MVNLPPDDAGFFDLLKLLEESLSLENLRFRGLATFCDNEGLGLASTLAAGEGADGAKGIFFFCNAPLGELAGGLPRNGGSDDFGARIELLSAGALVVVVSSGWSRIDRRIGPCPDDNVWSLLIEG